MDEYVGVETVNAIAAGRFMTLVECEKVNLSQAEADDLLRAGYIKTSDVETNATGAVEAAALTPSETATAPAQKAVNRKA